MSEQVEIALSLGAEEVPPLVFILTDSPPWNGTDANEHHEVFIMRDSLTNLQAASMLRYSDFQSYILSRVQLISPTLDLDQRERILKLASDPDGRYVIPSIGEAIQLTTDANRLLANQTGEVRLPALSNGLACFERSSPESENSAGLESGSPILVLLSPSERKLAIESLAASASISESQAGRFFPRWCFVSLSREVMQQYSRNEFMEAMPRKHLKPMYIDRPGFLSDMLNECGLHLVVAKSHRSSPP